MTTFAPPASTEGRAARRRAAQEAAKRARGRGRRRKRPASGGPVVVLSRLAGELFITLGLVMLLFVGYQLWYTNLLADRTVKDTAGSLLQNWDRSPAAADAPPVAAFEPGQGFAILYIPKLDVKVPVAEGTNKAKVLDKGLVGHYAEEPFKTGMPADRQGNFALAGHRNTHGEPFRYINRLVPGDKIVVETRDAYYTYEMTSQLAQTPPANVSVIRPVPVGSGFTSPGRYITLTTCTPEFTSTYRMIVWGRMTGERPRSQGAPPELNSP
ncbi:class E sortase [Streptomyces sp. ISL-66]|uniref:class E sortase n=1 Tax=Streptomyces sp. ISL-66 TaxID=2819186 RepID=UPI001BECAF6A|nr:class E sortase [Streptomyces sp. ISL-66]MBT2466319.1 class E sortase [Streptomyces sp. ISL-66]